MFAVGKFLFSLTAADKALLERAQGLLLAATPVLAKVGYSTSDAAMPSSWRDVLHGDEPGPQWLVSAAKAIDLADRMGVLKPTLEYLCSSVKDPIDLDHLLDLLGRATRVVDVPWQSKDPFGSLGRVARTVASVQPLGLSITLCKHCGEIQ